MNFKNDLIQHKIKKLWASGLGIEEHRGSVMKNIEWAEDYFAYEDPNPDMLNWYKNEILHYLNGDNVNHYMLVGEYFQEFPELNKGVDL